MGVFGAGVWGDREPLNARRRELHRRQQQRGRHPMRMNLFEALKSPALAAESNITKPESRISKEIGDANDGRPEGRCDKTSPAASRSTLRTAPSPGRRHARTEKRATGAGRPPGHASGLTDSVIQPGRCRSGNTSIPSTTPSFIASAMVSGFRPSPTLTVPDNCTIT